MATFASDRRADDEERGLGFLGGSFDPVHVGHLRGAMVVREALNLARVDLVPAAQSPLKPEAMLTGAHRLAMLELAIANVPGLAWMRGARPRRSIVHYRYSGGIACAVWRRAPCVDYWLGQSPACLAGRDGVSC